MALRRGPHVVWSRWKSQHRKIVYLPPYVEKVIKRCVTELRSRECFLRFGIPMLSLYVRYEHSMTISRFRIMDMLQLFCWKM